ncbi:MAG: hypothetical protein WAU65_02355 [Candidatus Nanoarchaeia archaeon]
MKKGDLKSFFALSAIVFILSIYFVSATYTLTVNSNETNGSTWYAGGAVRLFNFTIIASNLNTTTNITQLNFSLPNSTFASPVTNVNATSPAPWTCTVLGSTLVNCIGNSSNGSAAFMLNLTIKVTLPSLGTQANQTWNISSLDNYSELNWSLWNSEVDNVLPYIAFIKPTDGLNTSTINYSYIQANISLNDSGSGINTSATAIYLYNSTNIVAYSPTNIGSGYYFTNFTGLNNGIYYLIANATDFAGNVNKTANITITVNTTTIPPCSPNWGCINWGNCVNNTETCTSVNDSNSCGVTFNGTYATQACSSACTSYWSCSSWSPAVCTNGSQTRTCTDLNNCSQAQVQNQTCVSGGSLNVTQQQSGQLSGTSSSSSIIFYSVIGVIIVITVVVIVVLVRLKNKSSTDFVGNSKNSNSGYKPYSPPGGSSGNSPGSGFQTY